MMVSRYDDSNFLLVLQMDHSRVGDRVSTKSLTTSVRPWYRVSGSPLHTAYSAAK